jgi:hypothetical protein
LLEIQFWMKKLIFIGCVFLFSSLSGVGQDTVEVFTYGGEGEDVCKRILPNNQGYLLAGTTASFGKGPTDIYLVQVDRKFKVLKSKTIGGYDLDELTDALKFEEDYFLLSISNSENLGRYVGIVWKLDSNLEVIDQKVIDLGENTIPSKLLMHDNQLYVTGDILSTSEKTFVASYTTAFAQVFKKEFEKDKIGRIDSWISTDQGILTAYVRFDSGEDSTGVLSYYNANWVQSISLDLPDSIGIVRDLLIAGDSNILTTGDHVDTSINADLPILTVAKIGRNLDSIIWSNILYLSGNQWSAWGRKVHELNGNRVLVSALTNYQYFQGGLAIISTEFESNGESIFGNGSTYGWKYDDVINDAILIDDDTTVIAGYTESYGNGQKDVYLLVLRERSQQYQYFEENYLDTLSRILAIEVLRFNNEAGDSYCEQNLHGILSGQVQFCEMNIYSMAGTLIMRLNSQNIQSLSALSMGIYIVQSGNEYRKIFFQPR